MKIKRLNKLVSVALFSIAFCYSSNIFSQIKIGNNPSSLNPDAALEIESTNKGLLISRLSLSSTDNAAPLSRFVQGMFVYNTATLNDITPGIYYSDGAKWIKVNQSSTLSNSWGLSGNSGTSSSNNFVGTTDIAPLILKTNSIERLRISEKGWVGIGTASPSAALHVKGQMVIDSLSTGNIVTDNLLVANPADGRIKMVSSSSFVSGMQNRTEVVQTSGQTIFNTPDIINDINKILLYRNGILISFTLNNVNSIISEIPCLQGDEMRIFQLK